MPGAIEYAFGARPRTSMSASPAPESARAGFSATLSAILVAGLLVGGVIATFDGLVAAFGIDSSVFLHQVWTFGLAETFRYIGPAWKGIGGLLGCLAGTVFVYAGLSIVMCFGIGIVLTPWLRKLDAAGRRAVIASIALGGWLALELFWWTRPVVFSGLSMTDPRRLAASAGILAVGLLLGFLVVRLSRRLSPGAPRLSTAFYGLVFIAGGTFLFLDAAGSSERGRINERTEDMPNVLIFVVDALRQDVIGAYGSEEIKTPRIDRVAERGVVFDEAMVQAPFTWSSFGSMLTGKYPRRHGLLLMKPGIRMAPNITIPFHLKGAKRTDGVQLEETDYVSTAFLTGTLSQGSGLLRGFDVYFEALVGHEQVDVHSQWSKFRSSLLPYLIKNKLGQKANNRVVATAAIDWLRENAAKKRFVSLVHFYSTHTPYDPADEFKEMYCDPDYDGPIAAFYAESRRMIESGEYVPTEADERQIRNLYYGGVTMADAMIGSVLDEVERQGVLDDTIVIITSDHGEELGEHDLWEHNWMYQTNLRIPFVLSYPKALPQGVHVDAIVDTIDFLPTICDLMRIELPVDEHLTDGRGEIDGVSLVPLVKGEVERVRDYSIAENNFYRSIQDGRHKLIVRFKALEEGGFEKILAGEIEKPRFYDLVLDPDEDDNVFDQNHDQARVLWTALKEWSDSMPIGDHLRGTSDRDRENELVMRELMEKLGYTEGGIDREEEAPGRDE